MSTTPPPSHVPEAGRISGRALSEAEQLTGAQATLVEAQSPSTFSTICFAQGSNPAYVIGQRPDHAWAVDHLGVYLALFWAARWSEPGLAAPYPVSDHAATGARLLAVWRENQSDSARDHIMIDAWAELLGSADRYEWQPAENAAAAESGR